jgi:polar amino acid transport system substrate-binding protein
MRRVQALLLLCAVVLSAAVSQAAAPATAPEGASGPRLRVMVDEDPPFVMRDGERWSGWSIDLWTEVARQAGFDWQVVGEHEPDGIVGALATQHADIGVGDISVTKERAQRIDFSQPFFRGGLRVLVREGRGAGVMTVLAELATPAHVKIGLGALVLLIGMSVLVYVLARRHDADNFPTERGEAMVEAVYVAAGALLKGEISRKLLPGALARVLAIVWMFFGAAVVAYFTAAAAALITVHQLNSDFRDVDDLKGKRVGTVAGMVEANWLAQRGAVVVEALNIDLAIASLRDGETEAVVHKSPTLSWWMSKHPGSGLELVGSVFSRHDYAFALQNHSQLRVPINVALLSLEESGFIAELNRRWFGE